jgi:hypothetical protein
MHRLIGVGADSREQTGHPRQCCVNPIRHGTLSLTRLILINHKRRIHAYVTNFKPQFVLCRNMRKDTDDRQIRHCSSLTEFPTLPTRLDVPDALSTSQKPSRPFVSPGFQRVPQPALAAGHRLPGGQITRSYRWMRPISAQLGWN